MELELVTDGLLFPEGPIAMNDGSIILTEIEGRRLTRVAPDGTKTVVAETGGGPNGAAIGPDGKIYVANNGGSFEWLKQDGLTIPGPTPASHQGGYIQRVDIASGKVETVYNAHACAGVRLNGPNDLVFDKQGGIWFSDHGCGTPDGTRHGGVFYAKPDGSHIVHARGHMISPNGIGLSPDERIVYLADTHLGRLWAFDLIGPGQMKAYDVINAPRVVCNLPGYQLLDSLAVEAGGKVCVATIVNGGITAFDPDGSVEHYPVPDIVTTNIVFGGADMRDAWITASSTGKLYKCRWPRPGLKLNFNA